MKNRPAWMPPLSSLGLTLAGLSLMWLAAGCGVRENVLDDGQSTALSPVATWAQAVCAVRRACCGPDPDALYALASCEADLDRQYGLQAGYDEGRLRADDTILAQCLAAAQSIIGCQAADPDFAPCRGVLLGTVAEGGTCRSSYECARGAGGMPAVCQKTLVSHGDYSSPSETGVCRPSPLGKPGDACTIAVRTPFEAAEWATSAAIGALSSAPVVRCSRDQGLTCAGACTPLGHVGDACLVSDACAPGLVCGCGLCQNDATLALTLIVPCVDGTCQQSCPAPVAAPGREFCYEGVDPTDGQCRVEQLACGYSYDCPASWAAAQSPNSCRGGVDTFVLGACGDTFTWHRDVARVTCHYDKTTGHLVGVRNQTETADEFCYGSSPSHLERLAGHVPAACPSPSAGTTVACNPGCDGGA